jgi:hypothetical protein
VAEVVYISVGNSDDKLPQARWATFVREVRRAVGQTGSYDGGQVHGDWYSSPTAQWQNACWCLQLPDDPLATKALRTYLSQLAAEYGQDSIAWAPAAQTEFLQPAASQG